MRHLLYSANLYLLSTPPPLFCASVRKISRCKLLELRHSQIIENYLQKSVALELPCGLYMAATKRTSPESGRTKGKQMNSSITTAEEAARTVQTTRKGFTSIQMLCAIGDIRNDQPNLAAYLNHPEIVCGLCAGVFGPNGIKRRLAEMYAADAA